MPIFRVNMSRRVKRVVELDQRAAAFIDAPDRATADSAARKLAWHDDVDTMIVGFWEDDNNTRQASNDEVLSVNRVDRVYPPAAWSGAVNYKQLLVSEDE